MEACAEGSGTNGTTIHQLHSGAVSVFLQFHKVCLQTVFERSCTVQTNSAHLIVLFLAMWLCSTGYTTISGKSKDVRAASYAPRGFL